MATEPRAPIPATATARTKRRAVLGMSVLLACRDRIGPGDRSDDGVPIAGLRRGSHEKGARNQRRHPAGPGAGADSQKRPPLGRTMQFFLAALSIAACACASS